MTATSPEKSLPAKSNKSRFLFFLLPLIIFGGLSVLFFLQLTSGRNAAVVPSALIGKPIPTFDLAPLDGSGKPGFSTETASAHRLTLINVWGSWCAPCRAEHPFVMALSRDERLKIFGLNQRDNREAALAFLNELGDPYDAIGVDPRGRTSIDFGVYGVPETFLVDNTGTIVYKFIGPITAGRLKDELMPAIEKALAGES